MVKPMALITAVYVMVTVIVTEPPAAEYVVALGVTFRVWA